MNASNAVRRFVAHLLMAVGGLIAVLCGGCTVVVLWTMVGGGLLAVVANGHASLQNVSNAFGQAFILGAIAIIIGSLPTLIGVALFVVGRGMAKGER